jgi:hypothetical protein
LIDTFLFGISFTNDTNTPFPDVMFTQSLGQGKQWMADTLDIDVDRKTVKERHDLSRSTSGEWWMIRLTRRPVHKIKSVSMMVGSSPLPVYMPLSWIMDFDQDGGLFWIVPNANEIQNLTAMQYSIMSARQWAQWGNLPGFLEVEYDVGYDIPFEIIADPGLSWWAPPVTQNINGRLNIRIKAQTLTGTPPAAPKRSFEITGVNKVTGLADTETVEVTSNTSKWSVKGWSSITSVVWTDCEGDILFTGNMHDETNHGDYWPIDHALLDMGGKIASMYSLNVAGDLIAGAGIASMSLSMGGISQSKSTTSSATNSGYGSRIIQYRQDIAKDLPMVRRRFHGMPMITV